MEQVIRIEGGHRLNGKVRISGSKNSAVALIPACILSNEKVVLEGIPDINDVRVLISLLEDIGCEVTFDEGILAIDPSHMEYRQMFMPGAKQLRGSYYFMGAMLGRYGKCEIKRPGGCFLGDRPIDLHIKGFRALGAEVYEGEETIMMTSEGLHGDKIFLDIPSVGATINIMLAATLIPGCQTVIENAAREPEIIDVASLLNKMGADIYGMGTSTLIINGQESLHGCSHEVIPDRIEAATYLLIAAAMADDMTIENVIPKHLEAILAKLEEVGINYEIPENRKDIIHVFGNDPDKPLNPVYIETKPYPGFATDVQEPFTPLLTRCAGRSTIKETIYNQRFHHVDELIKMGAEISTAVPKAQIDGNNGKLIGTDVLATDLRGGAAMVIAGLMAQGVTTIHEISHIDRGYDHLDEKLQELGAKIWREERDPLKSQENANEPIKVLD